MKLGFSILSHQSPGSTFIGLLSELEQFPDKAIAIHHDFNQAPFDLNLITGYSAEIVKDCFRTYWSHTNNINAILATFNMLSSKNCDWFITLSTNCYPIKPTDYIIDFLKKTSFDGFMERNNVLTDYLDFYKYFRKGFDTKYLFKIPFISRKGRFYQRAIRKPRNKEDVLFNDSFIPYHGSDWFIISKKTMERVLRNESKINEIVNFLEEVNRGPDINVCPPEVVFQTLIGNDTSLNLCNNNYRYINWENRNDWHPNTLTINHWEAIKKTDALFARKFECEISRELLDRIDREILHKTI